MCPICVVNNQKEHDHVRELNAALKLEEQRLSEHRMVLEREKKAITTEHGKVIYKFPEGAEPVLGHKDGDACHFQNFHHVIRSMTWYPLFPSSYETPSLQAIVR